MKWPETRSLGGLRWPEILGRALWGIPRNPRQPPGFSPAQIAFGRHLALPGTFVPAGASLLEGDERFTPYVLYLQGKLQQNGKYAPGYQPAPPEIQLRDTQPAQDLPVQVSSGKSQGEPKREGPHTVLKAFTTLWVPLGCLY